MEAALFLSALVLALLLCSPPGAVNTEALRRGLSGGFGRAWRVELGSCVGDLAWAALALVGLAFLVTNDAARLALGFGGAALLVYLAYQAAKDARNGHLPEASAAGGGSDLATGAMISLGNPFQVAFWLGIGGSVLGTVSPSPSPYDFMMFFAGYITGLIVWSLSYSALIGYGRRYVTPTLFRVISAVCAAVMLFFAASLLWSTLV